MSALPVILQVAGTAMSAFGQHQAGRAASAEAKYQAQVQERQAQAAEQRTQLEQRRQAEEASRRKGALAASLGASGAVTTAGAPLMIMATQAREDEREQAMIGWQGREEAGALRRGAQMSRMKATQARRAGAIGAGTTLLHGFGSAFMK